MNNTNEQNGSPQHPQQQHPQQQQPQPPGYFHHSPPPEKPKRSYSNAERWLLLAALAIGILFDRLMYTLFNYNMPELWGVFWLCYLVVFYCFCARYRKPVLQSKLLWFIGACAAALCLWAVFFDGGANADYALITFLIIPGVLMMFTVLATGDYDCKEADSIAVAWLLGWVVKPFSGWGALFGAAGSLTLGGKKGTAAKILIGLLITLPLLLILLPLLGGADRIFGHYLSRIVENVSFGRIFWHTFATLLATALFYSLLWNKFFTDKTVAKPIEKEIDGIISLVILSVVTVLYIIFCGVQYAYLFGWIDLPAGLTFSEYIRSGFAQTVAVCIINLSLFGVFLRYSAANKTVNILLAGLLGLTGLMLGAGMWRLINYVNAFGMTWVRLLSAWFFIYAAAVIVICFVRMRRTKTPAVFICSLLLLVWFIALGYANPNRLIGQYNSNVWHGQYTCFETCALNCEAH
jgi:hypothetical protein